jgi:hypothetical protein
MTATVFNFPPEWYEFVSVGSKYRPRTINDAFPGRVTVQINGPVAKLWMADVIIGSRSIDLQDAKAFISQLDGRANVLRFADASRLRPWYDRNLIPTTATLADGSTFTDGSGFDNGYLPPNVFVDTAASRGANFIVLGGFPASTANVLRRGDLLEIQPNGVPSTFPHLYDALSGGASDSSGRIGIKIGERLRADIAANDTVSLRNASSLFRLTSDDQGDIEDTGTGVQGFGFSLAEALDLVP